MSNKDKLITSVFITLSLVLACYLQSCTTSTHLCDKYSTPKTIYKCPVFTN